MLGSRITVQDEEEVELELEALEREAAAPVRLPDAPDAEPERHAEQQVVAERAKETEQRTLVAA